MNKAPYHRKDRHNAPVHTAMIMAAGYGTRMRPLTHTISKAMVEVGGKPLIDHMIERLGAEGIKRIIINLHAHADHLEAHLKGLKTHMDMVFSDERDALLETGGGVVKALPLLGTDPVLICNIDAIWCEFSPVLQKLLTSWDGDKMDELFLLARRDASLGYDGHGDFDMNNDGQLQRRSGAKADHIYAGVEIFKPELARPFKAMKFSRNKIWDITLAQGRVYGVELEGYWMHVGDPQARLAAEAVLKEFRKNPKVRL